MPTFRDVQSALAHIEQLIAGHAAGTGPAVTTDVLQDVLNNTSLGYEGYSAPLQTILYSGPPGDNWTGPPPPLDIKATAVQTAAANFGQIGVIDNTIAGKLLVSKAFQKHVAGVLGTGVGSDDYNDFVYSSEPNGHFGTRPGPWAETSRRFSIIRTS